MMRIILAAVALAGCYSPSFDTCSLVCAAGDKCPDGFTCSAGRCAVEGSTCEIGPGGDGGVDTNTAGCGNGTAAVGELCFKTPIVIATGVNGIRDAQLVDANGDGARDLVYIGPSGLLFRLNMSGTFAATAESGPAVTNATRLRGVNLDTAGPELITNVSGASGRVLVYKYQGAGTSWASADEESGPNDPVVGIGVGRVLSSSGPPQITVASPTRFDIYTIAAAGAFNMMRDGQGQGLSVTATDMAVGDFTADGRAEIALATTTGISIGVAPAGTLTFTSVPSVTAPVSSVAFGNIDGEPGLEVAFASHPPGGDSIGLLRSSQGTVQVATTKQILTLLDPVDVADLDNDEFADVVAGQSVGAGARVLVLRGRADGLDDYIAFPVDKPFTAIHADADFNGDGLPDIVLTSTQLGLITILESNP